MVHINTKFQTKLPQLEMKVGGRVQFVPTLTQKRVQMHTRNRVKSDIQRWWLVFWKINYIALQNHINIHLPIKFKLVTSSYLNLFNSPGKIISS